MGRRALVVLNDSASVAGGADEVAITSAVALAAAGWPVHFLHGGGPVDARLMANAEVTVVALGGSGGFWNWGAARWMREYLATLERPIVLVHRYTQQLSPAVPAAAIASGAPTAFFLHDYFLLCPNGAFYEHPSGRFCERAPLSLSCALCRCDSRSSFHKAARLGRQWLQRRAGIPERAAALFAVSPAAAEMARRWAPASVPILPVPNPVTLGRPAQVQRSTLSNFLFVGRLERSKGADLVAEASRFTGLPVMFCGEGSLRDSIKRLAPKAILTGWLDRDALEGAYAHARALVFPSRFRETFGLAAHEALARGLPVIASRETAAASAVLDGENGLLVERGSASELADAMRRLAHDDILCDTFSATAYTTYPSHTYTLDRHVSALESALAAFP